MPGQGEMEPEQRLLARKYKLQNKQNERSRRSDFRLPSKKENEEKQKRLMVGWILLRHEVFQRCEELVNNCSVR